MELLYLRPEIIDTNQHATCEVCGSNFFHNRAGCMTVQRVEMYDKDDDPIYESVGIHLFGGRAVARG